MSLITVFAVSKFIYEGVAESNSGCWKHIKVIIFKKRIFSKKLQIWIEHSICQISNLSMASGKYVFHTRHN